MLESSKRPAKKSSGTKKTVSRKRTSPSKKSKKPKVVLAKTKVVLLCSLISGICVLSIIFAVLLNQPQETVRNSQNTETVAKTEPPLKNDNPPKKEIQPQKTKSEQPAKKTEKGPLTSKPAKKTEMSPLTPAPAKAVTTAKPEKTVTALPQNKMSKAGNPASQVSSSKTPVQEETVQKNAALNRFGFPEAVNGATVVIIIDDSGRSVENTKKYASLPFPLTIAVLPKLPQSRACADAIRALGKEVILHQPMQSLNHSLDPGPGKITVEMSTYEIASIVKENLLSLGPGVKGINNHEGSEVTGNIIKIGAVLEVCSEMGVYFLDSRTTAQTQAPQAALERDMHIFEKAGPYLDNDIDRAKMIERMRETLMYANRNDRAIVIGHVDKSVKILPDLLNEMYPEMRAKGYKFATPGMLKR